MNQIIEGMLTIVSGLKKKERREFLTRLITSGVLSEDEQDILVIESRRGEPTRPLDKFVKEMRKKDCLR